MKGANAVLLPNKSEIEEENPGQSELKQKVANIG